MAKSLYETSLWKSAFENRGSDTSSEEQQFFRINLEGVREKTRSLVSRISADMPGYTVHDITHLDALWETASIVASPEIALNPPEGFVFGTAVLLHDAAMTLAAYPGGLSELRETPTWADAVALHRKGSSRQAESSASLPPQTEAIIRTYVLRLLHAEKAAELAIQGWKLETGREDRVYLIEDSDLRIFYGTHIGTIAHSHWWPIARLERELDFILGPMVPCTQHSVDLLKLACLLRVSDALHIDRRRAPRFVRALEQPTGDSALHWTAQERLAFPRVDGEALVFTAGMPFGIKDSAAWWMAYDAIGQADKELRESDLLLRDRRGVGFSVRRIKGAGDANELARYVQVVGWRPIDTSLRISDVQRIIDTLGGEKLYGSDTAAPLRELLQNGIDAIQARRSLQGRPNDWGHILVQLDERNDGVWLTVEDTGIGMSEFVLTKILLDFGKSLWGSLEITEELPGLAAKGMNALGQFGIGFYSIFMIGDHVRITTRRYDRAVTDGLVLEFNDGLRARPILSVATSQSVPIDGGTRIEIKLGIDPRVENGIGFTQKTQTERKHRFSSSGIFKTLSQLVSHIAPAAEVEIQVREFGRHLTAVMASDWLSISPSLFYSRLSTYSLPPDSLKLIRSRMRVLTDGHGVYGRAAIWPTGFQTFGALTAGDSGFHHCRTLLASSWVRSLIPPVTKGKYKFPKTFSQIGQRSRQN